MIQGATRLGWWMRWAASCGAAAAIGALARAQLEEAPEESAPAPEGDAGAAAGGAEPQGAEMSADIVELARQTLFEQNSTASWVALLACIGAGVVGGWIVAAMVRSGAKRLTRDENSLRAQVLLALANPASLVALTLGVRVGLGFIRMPAPVAEFAGRVVSFLFAIAAFWAFWNLCGALTSVVSRMFSRTNSALDTQLAPLIRKTLRVFTLIVFALFVAENVFEADIKGFLAGLGIAGLAVSLAAQDSLRNVLGSITIIADRPFKIGDRIRFKGFDGPVEEIGFRSTRMRTLEGHVVTIPNLQIVNETIENVSLRKCIRRLMTISVTYDTRPEKLREALAILNDLLKDHEGMSAELPPVVAFDGFGESSLNIQVIYWYHPPEMPLYREFSMRLNFQILERFAGAGIDFAFPSRTLYVAGDEKRRLTLSLLSADLRAGRGPS